MLHFYLFLMLVFVAVSPFSKAELLMTCAKPVIQSSTKNQGLQFELVIHNNSPEKTRDLKISASCSCVQVVGVPTELLPGEKQTFFAVLTPMPLGGTQKYRLFAQQVGMLTPVITEIEAQLPKMANISPQGLFWHKNGETNRQEIAVELLSSDLELADVFAMDENFATSRRNVTDSKFVIEVDLRNRAISRPAIVMIELREKTTREIYRISVPCHVGENNPFQLPIFQEPTEQIDLNQVKEQLGNEKAIRKEGSGLSTDKITTPPFKNEK